MITAKGEEKIVNREKSAQGPIILYLQENRLMDDWESNQVSEISDYKYLKALSQSVSGSRADEVANADAIFQNETWVRDPPNVMFFSLARVQYDTV